MRPIAYRFRAATSPASASVGTGALARPRKDITPRLSSRATLGSCRRSRQLWISHCLLGAALIISLIASTTTSAATRPHYGGTLRVMLQSAPDALDLPANATPADYWDAARTLSLIGDTLVKLDAQARPQPALAVAWQSDPSARHWQFTLRRADSGRNPRRLECACIGGFRIDRERDAHACAARRTRAAEQSLAQAQYKSSSHRHRPVPHRRVAAGEAAQARRE